ncbi:MAG TPA: hypothetical protein VMM17_11000 [Gemmatimonadaceae bacterium]|nr:hypothetical protein [Gemmatimonadaceae bacterium]
MRTRHAGAALALAVLAMGCESNDQLLEPVGSPSLAVGAVEAAASGGGQAVLPAGFSELKFSFTATALANGKAVGQFRQVYVSGSGRVDFHGRVTCVSVDAANGRAWIGGVITKNNSTNPNTMLPIHQVGEEVWFRVLDDGEGDGAVDRTTVLGFRGGAGIITSAEYCATVPWRDNNAFTWPVVSGNIQVR